MKNLSAIIVTIIVGVAIFLVMCAFQVRFTETAVVTRFDKVVSVVPPGDAGLHWKWPWPIDQVYKYDTRLRAFDTEFRQAATKDQKTVILTAYATWRIADAEKFLREVGGEDTAAQIVRDLLENQVQLVLRDHELDELVNTDPARMKLGQLERVILRGSRVKGEADSKELAKTGIQTPAAEKYGIEVVSVGVKRLGLPESVTEDVFGRMKADRDREIKQYTAEGEAEATRIRVEAEEIASKIRARAEAYAKTIVGQGDAEAARYYGVFEKNLKFSTFLKKLEAIEEILKSGQITLIMDSNEFIPVDILREASKVAKPAGNAQE